jgi:hypothetical protein
LEFQTEWVCRKVGFPKGISIYHNFPTLILQFWDIPQYLMAMNWGKIPMFGPHPYIIFGYTSIFTMTSPKKSLGFIIIPMIPHVYLNFHEISPWYPHKRLGFVMSYLFKSTFWVAPNMAQTSQHGHLPAARRCARSGHRRGRYLGKKQILRLMDLVGWGFIDFHMEIYISIHTHIYIPSGKLAVRP